MQHKGLSRDYCRFRLKVFHINSQIWWFLLDGAWILLPWIFSSYFSADSASTSVIYFWVFISLYLAPMIITIFFYHYWLKHFAETYEWEVGEEEIVIRQGVFTRLESRVPYSRIQNVGIYQGFWERRNGWYNVLIQTAGGTIGGLTRAEGHVIGLRNAHEIQQLILTKAKKYLTTRVTGLEEIAPVQEEGVPPAKEVEMDVDMDEINGKMDKIISLLKSIAEKLK